MSTAKVMDLEARRIAAEEDIPIYKAEMLQYIEASRQETEAKNLKERLKERLKKRLRILGKFAESVEIPDRPGDVAVARIYEQREPHADVELARRILPARTFARIFTVKMGERFTVSAMSQSAAENCAETVERYWQEKKSRRETKR
jgi:hypothetical protein